MFTDIRKRGTSFKWNEAHARAFESLKSDLGNEPVVRIYESNKELVITTGASETAISAVLSQEGHPVLYLSRSLTPAEVASRRARNFLIGRHF